MMGPSAIGAQPPPDDLDEEWLMIQEDEERTEMHTQEPWMVDPDNRPGYEWNNHIVSATDPNQTICFMTHDNTPENIEGEANARRIVACVNACKGIKTESLEMEVLSWITDETGESSLKRERDELLAVLVGVEKRCAPDRFVGQDGQYLKVIRSAIAKVGAGETANIEQPLQKLGARLAELLDEDQFAECEALLMEAGVKPSNAEVI